MVVALSEEIWYQTYHTTLASMDLSARLLRYVDNRLCLADPSWSYEISFANFLHPEVLLHCTVCTKLQDFRNLTWCQHPNRFDVTSMSPRFGENFSSAY